MNKVLIGAALVLVSCAPLSHAVASNEKDVLREIVNPLVGRLARYPILDYGDLFSSDFFDRLAETAEEQNSPIQLAVRIQSGFHTFCYWAVLSGHDTANVVLTCLSGSSAGQLAEKWAGHPSASEAASEVQAIRRIAKSCNAEADRRGFFTHALAAYTPTTAIEFDSGSECETEIAVHLRALKSYTHRLH